MRNLAMSVLLLLIVMGTTIAAEGEAAAPSLVDGQLDGWRLEKPKGLDLVKYSALRVPPAVVIDAGDWPQGNGKEPRELRRLKFLARVADRRATLIIDEGEWVSSVEYKPFNQGEDLAFEKGGFRDWLITPPDGFRNGREPLGYAETWRAGLWDENRAVSVEILGNKKQGKNARLLVKLFAYAHPIDAEFVTGMAQSRISDHLKPHAVNGSMVLSEWATPGSARLYAWMSGERVVYLDLAGVAHESELLRPFLEKYPPTWPTPYSFDINQWHERLFAEALTCLRTGLTEPPPRLRYTFDDYQFERGIRKIRLSTLPDYHRRKAFEDAYESAISKAFETHILGTENRLDGEAYKAAVQAARQQAITTVEAWRDELRAAGGVELTKGGYQVRGTKPKP